VPNLKENCRQFYSIGWAEYVGIKYVERICANLSWVCAFCLEKNSVFCVERAMERERKKQKERDGDGDGDGERERERERERDLCVMC
jgi:hypothetical protein